MKTLFITLLTSFLFLSCEKDDHHPSCIAPPSGQFDPNKQNFTTISVSSSALIGAEKEGLLEPILAETIDYKIVDISLFFSPEEELVFNFDKSGALFGYSNWLVTEERTSLPIIKFTVIFENQEKHLKVEPINIMGDDIEPKGFFIFSIGILNYEKEEAFAILSFDPDYQGACNDTP